MYSTMQLAKLIALKRGLDPELAALTCAFHDIFTLQTGNHTDHGIKAEKIIREIIEEYNKKHQESLPVITEKEISLIIKTVAIHSDITTTTENPYEELLKDVDSIDSFLH
ncbi:MAG: HD domain-containing protein [Candidatus Heimdallarchaeota archaeon]